MADERELRLLQHFVTMAEERGWLEVPDDAWLPSPESRAVSAP